MDWFLLTLAVTTAVRGFGAGLIWDVALISLPTRRHLGPIPYRNYALVLFEGIGVRTYAPIAILGLLLTIAIMIWAFVQGQSAVVSWATVGALAATILAFLGTARALPALMSLRKATDDELQIAKSLDRFATWHSFSAIWQVVSFVALIGALAAQ
jgi:hypothetical protein